MNKLQDLNLTERELRVLSIVFISAMDHDWNEWFDGYNGMTGESQEYCLELSNKLGFIFKYLGDEGKEKYFNQNKDTLK